MERGDGGRWVAIEVIRRPFHANDRGADVRPRPLPGRASIMASADSRSARPLAWVVRVSTISPWGCPSTHVPGSTTSLPAPCSCGTAGPAGRCWTHGSHCCASHPESPPRHCVRLRPAVRAEVLIRHEPRVTCLHQDLRKNSRAMSEPINRSRFFVNVECSHIASSIDSPANCGPARRHGATGTTVRQV